MINHTLKETKPKGTLFLTILSCYLAVVGLLFGSRIGKSINIYEKTIYLLLAFAFFYFLIKFKSLSFHTNSLLIVFIMATQCVICYIQSGSTYLDYLRIFLIFIPFSVFPIHKNFLTVVSLFYGAFGLAVLIVANLTSLFAGWDSNSISLNAFFLYVVFIVSFCDTRKPKTLMFLVIYSMIYYLLLIKLNSRSSIIFSIFLCVLSIIPLKKTLNKSWLIIILVMPLLIAIFIVLISKTPLIDKLNIWSLNNTHKPIFNGRDHLWENGLKLLLKYPLFGTGNMDYAAHNSAITCLAGGGIIGYFIFITSIYSILKRSLLWLEDTMVFGLTAAFLTIWLQQSVELGLLAPTVNPTPYLILALLYAKIKTLEKENSQKPTVVTP